MRDRRWLMHVAVKPGSRTHRTYVRRRRDREPSRPRPSAAAAGFPPEAALDLQYFGGKTIAGLAFTNLYVGGEAAWTAADRTSIDGALEAAMADQGLNGIVQQYFPDDAVTATMRSSRALEGDVPARVFKDTVEGWVADLDLPSVLDGGDPASTVFNFILPRGVGLVDGSSTEVGKEGEVTAEATISFENEEANSLEGLGGFHGSVHVDGTGEPPARYYAVGVYSEPTAEGENGIVAFDEPWKNVVATFYHELQEARTDADVEDAIRENSEAFLGWYAPGDGRMSGEIGDTPMEEAGADLGLIMKEMPLADGSGTVPIQLMWSNRDHGPGMPEKAVP
jgi:hypothetical protein